MAKARAIVKRRKAVRQHPQDHADDGADRHRPLPEGARPRHRGRGVHPQDRRAGRRPGRDLAGGHAPAARTPRAGQAVAAAGADEQPRAGRRLQRQRPARRHTGPIRTTRPKGSRPSLEVAGKRGINYFRFRRHRRRTRPTPSSRTGRSSTRSRSSPTATSRCTSRARSTGSTWPTRSSSTPSRQVAIVADAAADHDRRASARPARRSARPKPAATAAAAPRGRSAVPYEFLPDAAEHPRGDRAGLVQGAAVQVLPRRRRQRADRPHGRHGGGHRERRRHDQVADPAVQPRPAEPDHPGAGRDHRRRRGPRSESEANDVHRTRRHAVRRSGTRSKSEESQHSMATATDDRTHRPGDRLDVRRRVRRRAPARTSTTP